MDARSSCAKCEKPSQASDTKAWDAFVLAAPDDYRDFEKAWLVARLTALEAAGLVTLADSL